MARSIPLKFNVLKVQLPPGFYKSEKSNSWINYNEKNNWITYKIIIFHEHSKKLGSLGNVVP